MKKPVFREFVKWAVLAGLLVLPAVAVKAEESFTGDRKQALAEPPSRDALLSPYAQDRRAKKRGLIEQRLRGRESASDKPRVVRLPSRKVLKNRRAEKPALVSREMPSLPPRREVRHRGY